MSQTKNVAKIISDAESLGIAHPLKVRNLEIRRKFKSMREHLTNYDDAVHQLAHEYCRSFSTIAKIVVGITINEN